VIDCLRDLAHPAGRLKAALFLLVGLRRLPRPLAPRRGPDLVPDPVSKNEMRKEEKEKCL
jgi:hypothetical protein